MGPSFISPSFCVCRGDQERWEGEEAGATKSAPTKACVFSQFTKSLDMMEHELAASGIQ